MSSLAEILAIPAKRGALVVDCVRVIDEEVDAKSGLTGIAVKAAYKLVKSFKPGFVPEVVDALLDDFARNLQPLLDEAQAQKVTVAAYLTRERSRAAEALLAITDERAQASRHTSLKSAYQKLRGSAKKYVEDAMPRVGAMLERNLRP